MLGDLLDLYNEENQDSPYVNVRDMAALNIRETHALIRVTAICTNMEGKIRPHEWWTTVTEIMEQEELGPDAIFMKDGE